MKRLRLTIIVSILLASTLFTGCGEHSEDYLQNVVFVSNRYEGAKLHNGDKIPVKYYCEFPISVEVRLSELNYGKTIERYTIKTKRGDGEFYINLHVDDYIGKVGVGIEYCSASAEGDEFEDNDRKTEKEFCVEIVAPDEETSWGGTDKTTDN